MYQGRSDPAASIERGELRGQKSVLMRKINVQSQARRKPENQVQFRGGKKSVLIRKMNVQSRAKKELENYVQSKKSHMLC